MGCLINPTLAWNTMPQITVLFRIVTLHLSEYLFPQKHFEGGGGEMPTSEETRFEQGYQEQVLLPQSPSSQNRTLFVSTPAAMINTALLFWELLCCMRRHDTSSGLQLSKQTYLKFLKDKKKKLALAWQEIPSFCPTALHSFLILIVSNVTRTPAKSSKTLSGLR